MSALGLAAEGALGEVALGEMAAGPIGWALLAATVVVVAAATIYNASKSADDEMADSDADSTEECPADENAEQTPDEEDPPPRRKVSPKRREHILDGDETGGGHRPGTGKPGKSEFPNDWSDDRIIDEIEDVANDPSIPEKQQGRRIIKEGTRDGIDIKVVVDPDGDVVTGYPANVPRNP